jgi:hypothetical protein
VFEDTGWKTITMIRLNGQQVTRLQTALLKIYLNRNAFNELLTRLNQSYEELSIEGSTYKQNVLAAVKDAAATGWLMPLIAAVRAEVPDDTEFQQIEQEFAMFAPPAGMDFFDMCRLSGGHVMIDRTELREALRDINNPVGKRILIIKGNDKSGKSHSVQLISYVYQMQGAFTLVTVDLEDRKRLSGSTKPVDPLYLADRIVAQLPGDFNLPDPPRDAQWANWVIKFCDTFQKYGLRNLDTHWIVIDSFNNVPLEQAAFDLVKELARRINVTLTNFRLVLIGYTESLPSTVLPIVAEDTIIPIDENHLIEFFYVAYKQSRKDPDEEAVFESVQRLFDQVQPGEPDFLERLGPLASEELAKVLARGGANG